MGVQEVCEAVSRPGGTWNKDGVIVFGGPDGLRRASMQGGGATRVTTADASRRENFHRWPAFLPDGRHLLYTVQSSNPEAQGIYVRALDGPTSKRLLPAPSKALYVASGHLLYGLEGNLVAQRFDAQRLDLAAAKTIVAGHLWFYMGTGGAVFSASENGILAYGAGGSTKNRIAWHDRTGRQLGPILATGEFIDLDLSPDETQVALERLDPATSTGDIWLLDVVRHALTRLRSALRGTGRPYGHMTGSGSSFHRTATCRVAPNFTRKQSVDRPRKRFSSTPRGTCKGLQTGLMRAA